MKKLIVTILVIIILLGGYWFFERQAPSVENDVDISNWQTFRSEEFGFEMKYPDGWSESSEEATAFQFQNTKLEYTFSFESMDKSEVLNVSMFDNSEFLDLRDWVTQYSPNPNAFEVVTVDNEQGRRYRKNAMGNDINEYIIPFRDKIYIIDSNLSDPKTEKFIDRFRFLK